MINIPERATLKICKIKAATVSGVATLLLKVPGDVGVEGARIIEGGHAYFENHHHDDFALVHITDEDNILGYGAGTIVGSYSDVDVPEANQGWYFKPTGDLQVNALGGLGRLLGGLYLKIIGTKGDLSADTLRVNIVWGIQE